MSETNSFGIGLERLVDSHIELCELFDETKHCARSESPLLITMSGGKDASECLADLVDRALVAYESYGFAQDPTIFALKIALTEAIMEMT
jgi:hypothetical protein